MAQELFDIRISAVQATNWRLLANVATMREMRAFCLNEARLCEQAIRRSLLKLSLTKTAEERGDPRCWTDRQKRRRSLKRLTGEWVQVANVRKKHAVHFEAKIALAAAHGESNIADLSIQYDVHVRACRQLAVWASGGESPYLERVGAD